MNKTKITIEVEETITQIEVTMIEELIVRALKEFRSKRIPVEEYVCKYGKLWWGGSKEKLLEQKAAEIAKAQGQLLLVNKLLSKNTKITIE